MSPSDTTRPGSVDWMVIQTLGFSVVSDLGLSFCAKGGHASPGPWRIENASTSPFSTGLGEAALLTAIPAGWQGQRGGVGSRKTQCPADEACFGSASLTGSFLGRHRVTRRPWQRRASRDAIFAVNHWPVNHGSVGSVGQRKVEGWSTSSVPNRHGRCHRHRH